MTSSCSADSINSLYSSDAILYALLANDRHFQRECEVLLSQTANKEGLVYYDLFAGPAYHAKTLKSQQKNLHCYAFDNAKIMRTLACQNGEFNPDHYYVVNLPQELSSVSGVPKADIISIMRYSIGLLSLSQIHTLLEICFNSLNWQGNLWIECHQEKLIQEQFASLAIKARHHRLDAETEIYCYWPAGKLIFLEDSSQVIMPIRLELHQNGKMKRMWHTESKEYLIGAKEISIIAQNYGFHATQRSASEDFSQSDLICLTKNKRHNYVRI